MIYQQLRIYLKQRKSSQQMKSEEIAIVLLPDTPNF